MKRGTVFSLKGGKGSSFVADNGSVGVRTVRINNPSEWKYVGGDIVFSLDDLSVGDVIEHQALHNRCVIACLHPVEGIIAVEVCVIDKNTKLIIV